MQLSMTQADERATAVITNIVVPGFEKEFEEWERGINQAAKQFEGYQGVDVVRTSHGDLPEYIIILHFDTHQNLSRWENSQIRTQWLEHGREFIKNASGFQVVTGIEYWFTLPEHAGRLPPPRRKMIIVTWLAITPLVRYILPFIIRGLEDMSVPSIGITWLSTAAITLLMAYLAMPLMTRLFARWLYD